MPNVILTQTDNLLLAAKAYLQMGWSIIPLHHVVNGGCSCGDRGCKAPGKHPRINWTQYQTKHPMETELKQWWTRWPKANIGGITGKLSGRIVLDIDRETGLKTIENKKLTLPPAPCVRTGGNGWHYFFKWPGFDCQNFAGKKGETILSNVDFRGDGGLVVLPPSTHIKGVYEWLITEKEEALAAAPDWLLRLIREQASGIRKLTPAVWKEMIIEGRRNQELTRMAGSLLSRMEIDDALPMLFAWNIEKCVPPLPEEEVRRSVESIAKKEARKATTGKDENSENPLSGTPYKVESGRICWIKNTNDGPKTTYLCNFFAQVVREIERDDGLETTLQFEVRGTLSDGRTLRPLQIPADRFTGMSWTCDWGMSAVVSAGMGAKDRLREAIQLVSQDAKRERIFTHIGWRQIEGRWTYLYTDGAVGANNIQVDPDGEGLRRYQLPSGGDPVAGMRESLKLLNIGPAQVVNILLAAVYRAPTACLLYPDLVPFVYGGTGEFKSTLAALFLSHFGRFTRDTLPASWLSTDNALEKTASLCHDAILVIDDYAPEQNPREASILDRRVNRLVRQLGNRAARGRLRSDLTQRPEYIPNALVISTGEQLPLSIGSVAARILPIQVDRKQINIRELSACQAQAYLLPAAMRGYLEWLAPQMDTLRRNLTDRFAELRRRAEVDGHARLPEMVAHLQLGAELCTRFALEIGAATQDEVEQVLENTWDALLELAKQHAKTLHQERPVLRFLNTLDAIFSSDKGCLKDKGTDETGEFGNGGELLGWYDDDDIYLIPEASYRAIQEFLRNSGGFPVRERTLRDQLLREGLLNRDQGGRLTTVIRVGERTRRVLALNREKYMSLLSGTTGNIGNKVDENNEKVKQDGASWRYRHDIETGNETVTEPVTDDPNVTGLLLDVTKAGNKESPTEHGFEADVTNVTVSAEGESLENEAEGWEEF